VLQLPQDVGDLVLEQRRRRAEGLAQDRDGGVAAAVAEREEGAVALRGGWGVCMRGARGSVVWSVDRLSAF